MAYVKTIWVDDTAPDIDAENLNKMEQGIFDAHSDIEDIIDGDIVVGKAEMAMTLDPSFEYPVTITPLGAIVMYGTVTAPTGWLECHGQAVSRTTYNELYAVIGTNFGSGDGSTTFNLPDMRGAFARGWDNGRGLDPSRNLGSYQADAYKSHSHSFVAQQNIGGYTDNGGDPDQRSIADTRNTNASGGSETRPKNVALMYIIKYS